MGDFGVLGLIHLAVWVYAVIQIFGSSAKTEIKLLFQESGWPGRRNAPQG